MTRPRAPITKPELHMKDLLTAGRAAAPQLADGALTLKSAEIAVLAERLHKAEQSRTQIRQFSLEHPQINIADAYAIQRAWIDLKLASGRKLVGHKIGLTSKAMQRSSNIDEPDYGALLDDMIYYAGDDIPTERFILPRVEVELAFILKTPLTGPNCTLDDVLAAIEWVIPAVEIIDARIHQRDPTTHVTRKVADTISDNAANAAVILSRQKFRPEELDLRWTPCLCFKNGGIEESGVAAAVLGHPATGVAWLANKLAPHGVALKAGEIVLGGSFIAPVPAEAGDVFCADYGPAGRVDFRFV